MKTTCDNCWTSARYHSHHESEDFQKRLNEESLIQEEAAETCSSSFCYLTIISKDTDRKSGCSKSWLLGRNR